MSDYYDHGTVPSSGSIGSSAAIRSEFDAIQTGISNKLAPLTGNGGKLVGINTGATAQEAVSTTGTGNVVRSTSPTLVTPALGTPTSIVLTNATGFPAAIYQRSNILGTVSQSAGVPTGAIIETGSNANGTYIKWADGTMICFIYKDVGSIAITSALGALYYSASTINITYPAAFVGSYPAVTQNLWGTSGVSWATMANANLTLSQYYTISYSSFTQQHYIFVIAVGKWY